MNKKLFPSQSIEGHRGYYPVCNAEEWDALPDVYKAMEWFPVKVYNDSRFHAREEMTVAEYIIFDVIYAKPYAIRAEVKVHVQEVQKILFCCFENTQFHLHSICGVEFANGVRCGAEWQMDSRTGAFAVYASGKLIGKQGGYMGYIPSNITETEDGFDWDMDKGFKSGNRCHYQSLNPFSHR